MGYWVYTLIGFLIMLGILMVIGIDQPRGTSVKTWCYGYLAIAVTFDVLVVIALVNGTQYAWLIHLLLGLSAGAATGLAIHVAHHISEEDQNSEDHNKKTRLMFGF
ncbi:MAG: hypothetical protein QXU99_01830 [Candidatus Bathyarchaeia archaeon]